MIPDRLNSLFKTASQGLDVQKKRLEISAQNIANSRTTAKPGSSSAYKVQTVINKAPGVTNFMNALDAQMNPLKVTKNQHFPVSGGAQSLTDYGSNNLGPEMEVRESEQFRFEYDPKHPDADENGMVAYPDVDMVKEMATMVSANRLYEANLSVIEAAKQMMKRSMEI